MMEFIEEIAHEPEKVYAISFCIFWALIIIYLRKPVFRWLDGEIAKITVELNTARELRAEAEAALADVKVKQIMAEKEAREIVDMARKQAASMRQQADDELAATLARQKQLASERIRMAEAKAIDAVRSEAVKIGMELARKTLTQDLSDDEAKVLVERSIADAGLIKTGKVG
ncbi:MAG: hypothetical protein PHE27_08725 [Alphaproteobacteria bacterium]|nr:hypothetical protein [Alphaproteobacteria bacterium]